ncbi:MAG: hypothetical protein II604_09285 [Bacteroidales bacterium]|nr:hypothetical protein [Bacteroidales bacterium]
MKFTKEEAVKKLEAKYTSKVEKIDKWKRTIEESVDHAIKLIGDSSELELEQFIDLVVPFLDTTAGFLRKENSDLSKDFNTQISTLKEEVATLKKDKTKTEGKEEPSEEMKKLLERIDALEAKNQLHEAEKTVSEKKSEIKRLLKEKGVKREDWIDMMLSEANIDDKTDIEAKATSYLTMYNKMYANVEFTDTLQETNEEPEAATKKTNDVVAAAAAIAKQKIV